MIYEDLRQIADSWGLVMMGVFFLTFVGWTFRPAARGHHHDAAHMIFDEDKTDV